MGRKRTKNYHLPSGVHLSRGWHFWRDPSTGKWHKLGKEWDRAAKNKWVELSTGKAPDGSISELLDAFLDHCEHLVRSGLRSRQTHEGNELEAGMLKAVFGAMHYKAVTSKHVASYLRKRTSQSKGSGPDGKPLPPVPAPVRANREIALLSSAYAWAMAEDNYDITSNPCYGVRRNTERPRDRYVETSELRRFTRGYAPRWLRCYCLLKRLTGLRQADMLKLEDTLITDRGIELQVGKTGHRITFRWTWALRIVVRAAQALRPPVPEGITLMRRPLFLSRYGTALTSRGFKSQWQRSIRAYVTAGGERFTEHDLRAKTASDARDITTAQQLLDHATPAMTQRYRRAPTKVHPLR